MRSKFIGFLGSVQALFVMVQLLAIAVGSPLPWLLVLSPLLVLLFVAVVFWAILGALFSKFG